MQQFYKLVIAGFTGVVAFVLFCMSAGCDSKKNDNLKLNESAISKADLFDKIKGGWAGQVIGCTYGGPTEFIWNGTMIDDHVPIPWDDMRMLWYFEISWFI